MKRKTLILSVLTIGTVALAGAAWISTHQGPPVGAGKTVHVMLTPT